MLINPRRGEVWRVDLEPTRGAEMRKVRPAVVISSNYVGRLPLRLIVPLTGWEDTYASLGWMTQITPDPGIGLIKTSGADAFQMRSVSLERFGTRMGVLPNDVLARIAKAIALTVEFAP